MGRGPDAPVAAERRRCILVVDDELDILETVRQLLEYKFPDATAVVVPSATAALTVLETTAVDLLVTDFRMPGMDGAELVTRVRKKWPQTPVVMMTAYLEPATHEELSRRAPGLDVMAKPLELDVFLPMVEKFLAKAPSS
jgi:CheY-like chemotaxis protein